MGFSIWHLLVVLLIVILLFGTKRLSGIGRDLGGALKGFRDAVREPTREEPVERNTAERRDSERVIEGKVESKEKDRS